MKLPEVTGKNRIRDAKICHLYATQQKTAEEIALTFKLSATRIYKILYNNKHLIKADTAWEKTKRILWLERQIARRGDSRKDSADLVEQMRKEIEGDKPLFEQHTHYNITWKNADQNAGNRLLPAS